MSEIIGRCEWCEIPETVERSRVGECERWVNCLRSECLMDQIFAHVYTWLLVSEREGSRRVTERRAR